jgi:hypothetical protein
LRCLLGGRRWCHWADRERAGPAQMSELELSRCLNSACIAPCRDDTSESLFPILHSSLY